MGGKVSRQVAWNWLLSFMVSWPKAWKSRSMTQRAISAMRAGTSASARNCRHTPPVRHWLLHSGASRAHSGRSSGSAAAPPGLRAQCPQGPQSNELGFKGRVLGHAGRALGSCTSPPRAGLTRSRGLVSTLVCMPTVLPVSFFSALTCEEQTAWTMPRGPRPVPSRPVRPSPALEGERAGSQGCGRDDAAQGTGTSKSAALLALRGGPLLAPVSP